MRFEFGSFGRLQVRRESVRLGLPVPVRLLYASDLHLGHWWTARVPEQLLQSVRSVRPDVVLLGGDLVDRATAIPDLACLTQSLAGITQVLAVPGNHDERVGLGGVRDAIRSAGGQWLLEQPMRSPIRVDGEILGGGPSPRVLCAHDPIVFLAAAKAGYDLILAGHLHGGQCVLINHRGKQYPAAWFNRWHGLRFEKGKSVLLVSRGVADTFPFRFNCPREVLLCDLS